MPFNNLLTPELRKRLWNMERELYAKMPETLWHKIIKSGNRKALIDQACRSVLASPFYHNLATLILNSTNPMDHKWTYHFRSVVVNQYHLLRAQQQSSTK